MLVGHQSIYERLKRDSQSGTLHHAHLFLGPEHVGKTKTAMNFANFLQGGEEDVIVKRQLLQGLDPDTLLFLDDGESLPIESIRNVIERVNQGHSHPYLIVVIENLARLRPEAMNALLKTLEEPHPGTVFFLTANQEEDVLATIRSRAQTHFFQTVPDEEMTVLLDGHPLGERLFFFAMGRPGKLLRLKEDAGYLDAHETLLRDLSQFMDTPKTSSVFALVRKYEGSELVPELLDIVLRRVRGWMLTGTRPQVLGHLDLTHVLEQTEDAKMALRNNVNTKLLLENLFLTYIP